MSVKRSPPPFLPNRLLVHSIGTIRHQITLLKLIPFSEHQCVSVFEWPAVLVHPLRNNRTSPAFIPVPIITASVTHLSSPRIPKSESLVTTKKFTPERGYCFKLSQICPVSLPLNHAVRDLAALKLFIPSPQNTQT